MLADWTVPFNLTSALYSGSPLPLNQYIANTGYYFLRQEGCALRNTVRSQKNDIPQADGAILHRRFTSGMEMDLAIQLWETTDQMACDALFLEVISVIMLVLPIFQPIVQVLGIHPIHFGVMLVLNLMIGLLTPPVGFVLYVLSAISNRSFGFVVRAVTPWIIPLIIALLLITLIPELVLFLPRVTGFA